MAEGLTAKQARFVEEYLDCLNATEAARRAGYSSPRQVGSENLSKPYIQAAIQAGMAERAMPADEVLARLSAIARADIRELIRFERPKAREGEETPDEWLWRLDLRPDAPMHLVKKITPNKYGYAIELHDPLAALSTLAKHHGLLGSIDWSKVPAEILGLLAEGKLTINDLRSLTTPGAE